jgi:hypothetical protein
LAFSLQKWLLTINPNQERRGMKQLAIAVFALVFVLTTDAFAQRSANPSAILHKSERVHSQLSRSVHRLSQQQLVEVSRLLSQLNSTINGRGGNSHCRGPNDPRCNPGGGIGRVDGVDIILAAVGNMVFSSDKGEVLGVGTRFLDDPSLNRLVIMCSYGEINTSSEVNCLLGAMQSVSGVLLSVPETRELILDICDNSSSSTELNCLNAAMRKADVRDFDFILDTCNSYVFSSDKVSCIRKGLN